MTIEVPMRNCAQRQQESLQQCLESYIRSKSEIKEPDADAQTDQDADSHGKALGNVVGILDAQRHQYTPKRLNSNREPHEPVVADEESMLGDLLAINEHDSDEQCWEERVECQLHVPDP